MELTVAVYTLTANFPKEEIYGLTSQMRRAVVSIPANIAEGRHRGTRKDFLNFLRIAYSSGAELETHMEIARKLKFGNPEEYHLADTPLMEVMKMLGTMLSRLKSSEAQSL